MEERGKRTEETRANRWEEKRIGKHQGWRDRETRDEGLLLGRQS